MQRDDVLVGIVEVCPIRLGPTAGPHKIGWMGWGRDDQFAYRNPHSRAEQADVESAAAAASLIPYKGSLPR